MTGRRILVTGGTGQVGSALLAELAPLGTVIAPARDALDLRHVERARAHVRALAPHVIVNAGAYTAVDRAEDEPDEASRVNGDAPQMLAEECVRLGATLVHFSTDYVFDGSATTPYTETSLPSPRNAYGMTKLRGDRAVAGVGGRHLILRTGWVYAARGRNFLDAMLRRVDGEEPVRVVGDQRGAPTPASLLARAVATMLAHARTRAAAPGDAVWGVYNVAASGDATWYDFAAAIFAEVARRGRPTAPLVRIATADYPTRASRPAYSVLDTAKARATFDLDLPPWDAALAIVLDERLRSDPV